MIDYGAHPWMRGLFGDIEIAEIFSSEAELERLLRIEAAWTRALGVVEQRDEAEAVASRIELVPIRPIDLKDGVSTDGLPIPALVQKIKEHLGAQDCDLVHKGLTSQDVLDTSLVLALADVVGLMSARLSAFDQSLVALQESYGDRSMRAFTRMQPALPTTVRDMIDRWRQPLLRLSECIAELKRPISVIQWGGPVGLREHAKAEVLGAEFARNLGLRDPQRAWHTDRTRLLDFAYALSRITVTTGKLGEDVVLYAVSGSGEIAFKGGSSSAMAHKNNPVKAETLVSLADYSAMLMSGIIRSARHEGHRSGQAWTMEWLTLPQLCVCAGVGLNLACQLVEEIRSVGRS